MTFYSNCRKGPGVCFAAPWGDHKVGPTRTWNWPTGDPFTPACNERHPPLTRRLPSLTRGVSRPDDFPITIGEGGTLRLQHTTSPTYTNAFATLPHPPTIHRPLSTSQFKHFKHSTLYSACQLPIALCQLIPPCQLPIALCQLIPPCQLPIALCQLTLLNLRKLLLHLLWQLHHFPFLIANV